MSDDGGKAGEKRGRPGVGIDAQGGPAIDPTKNVLDALDASTRRQDDLRAADAKLFDLQFRLTEQIAALRSSCARELASAESVRVDQQLALRDHFNDELRKAEASRIDAIRSVDVNAVAVAGQRAADQAAVLAAQLAASTEANRTLVATTATAFNASLQQVIGPISQRLTTLEQGSYQMTGKGEGIGASWAIFLAVAALLIGAFGAIFAFERSAPAAPVAPQIVYLPAPAAAGAIVAAPKP